jgi:hypothetical protein
LSSLSLPFAGGGSSSHSNRLGPKILRWSANQTLPNHFIHTDGQFVELARLHGANSEFDSLIINNDEMMNDTKMPILPILRMLYSMMQNV